MKYAIIENSIVVNLAKAETPLADNWIAFDGIVDIGDSWDGEKFIPKPPKVKTADELIAEVTVATQKRLDDFAKTRNYDGILSAASYAVSSHPPFASEGRYCADMRDATWGALYTIMAEVQAGTRPMPSGYEDIETLLPELVWP